MYHKNTKKFHLLGGAFYCDEQKRFDASNLIKTGLENGDDLTFKIGQARLRVLEGRPTADDLELLGIEDDFFQI